MEELKPVGGGRRDFGTQRRSILFVLLRFFDTSRFCSKDQNEWFLTELPAAHQKVWNSLLHGSKDFGIYAET